MISSFMAGVRSLKYANNRRRAPGGTDGVPDSQRFKEHRRIEHVYLDLHPAPSEEVLRRPASAAFPVSPAQGMGIRLQIEVHRRWE